MKLNHRIACQCTRAVLRLQQQQQCPARYPPIAHIIGAEFTE